MSTNQEAITRYEVITQEDPDNGDILIPIPPQLLKQMNWHENDSITIKLASDGRYIITREQQ